MGDLDGNLLDSTTRLRHRDIASHEPDMTGRLLCQVTTTSD